MLKNRYVHSPQKHFAVFLWFAGHEACSYRDLADRFDLSLSTVCIIISRIIYFLSAMSTEVICWPEQQQKEEMAEYFGSRYGFNGQIGKIKKNCMLYLYIL
jgi:hypothetical protein